MQKSYVVKLTVFFSDVDIYVREGDVCVHTPTENKLTIYRGGEILKTCVRTTDSIESMVKLGWIKHHQPAAEEAPAPVVESTPAKVEEPKSAEPKAEKPKTEDAPADDEKADDEADANDEEPKTDAPAGDAAASDEKAEAPVKKAKKAKTTK